MKPLVVVSVPDDKRTRALGAALARANATARWIAWGDAIRDPAMVGAAGQPGDHLRVESPGSDETTWRALSGLATRGGDWRPGRAWFHGLTRALDAIEAGARHLVATHPAATVAAMVDKTETQRRLAAAGVPVPDACDAPSTPAALRAGLDWPAMFVKPRWGSSGAGVLALRRARDSEQLVAAAALDGTRIVNVKRLRTYTDRDEIDALLAPVLDDGAIVQRWIPKASTSGGPFDLRVLVVDGRVTHRIARVARGPITNLHLDAARADASAVLARFGTTCARRVDEACVAAAACFDGHRCVGVDAMIDANGRPYVLECNAWGDYLPGLLTRGLDSYDVQLRALEAA